MQYHPRIGYTYIPNTKARIPWRGGGYLVRTNAAGYRSDREFLPERAPGSFRALLFGDSQTAGDGVANSLRYSDLLEKALPGLEIYNYGLPGTGTDQQFLAYQENAAVAHDLLILGLFAENIRRVSSRIHKSRDAKGDEYFRAKPYFEIENRELVLHNVPVPKQPWTEQTLPAEYLPYVYPPHVRTNGEASSFFSTVYHGVRALGRRLPIALDPLKRAVKTLAMRFRTFQPAPDYDTSDNPGWLLLRKIHETWIGASRTPVLLVAIPHFSFLGASADPSSYQARLRELAEGTGCHLYDPLPDLLKLTAKERRALWSDSSGHLSARGHEAMAHLLAPVIERLMREQRALASGTGTQDGLSPAEPNQG